MDWTTMPVGGFSNACQAVTVMGGISSTFPRTFQMILFSSSLIRSSVVVIALAASSLQSHRVAAMIATDYNIF